MLEENGFALADAGGLTSSDLAEMGIAKLKERKGRLEAFRAHAGGAAEGGGGAAAAAPTLRAQLAETLSCAVRMEVYQLSPGARTPKALPCMHSFCESCLLAHARGRRASSAPRAARRRSRQARALRGRRITALFGTLESPS